MKNLSETEMKALTGRTVWFRSPYKDMNEGTVTYNRSVNLRGQLYITGIVHGLEFSLNIKPADVYLTKEELLAANRERFDSKALTSGYHASNVEHFKKQALTVEKLRQMYFDYLAMGEALMAQAESLLGKSLDMEKQR